MRKICLTMIVGRPKLEQCFLSRRLRRALLPEERNGDALSGRESNTQPSNWEADALLLSSSPPIRY